MASCRHREHPTPAHITSICLLNGLAVYLWAINCPKSSQLETQNLNYLTVSELHGSRVAHLRVTSQGQTWCYNQATFSKTVFQFLTVLGYYTSISLLRLLARDFTSSHYDIIQELLTRISKLVSRKGDEQCSVPCLPGNLWRSLAYRHITPLLFSCSHVIHLLWFFTKVTSHIR